MKLNFKWMKLNLNWIEMNQFYELNWIWIWNELNWIELQEKAAKLSSCVCDGSEDYDCPAILNNMDRLCFAKKHAPHPTKPRPHPTTHRPHPTKPRPHHPLTPPPPPPVVEIETNEVEIRPSLAPPIVTSSVRPVLTSSSAPGRLAARWLLPLVLSLRLLTH